MQSSDQKKLKGRKNSFGLHFQVTLSHWETSGQKLKHELQGKNYEEHVAGLILFSLVLYHPTAMLMHTVGWAL